MTPKDFQQFQLGGTDEPQNELEQAQNFEQFEIPPSIPDPLTPIVQTGSKAVLARGNFESSVFKTSQRGFKLTDSGQAEFQDISIGGRIVTISSGASLQDSINDVAASGGGSLHFKSGSYRVSSTITGTSSVTLEGDSASTTVVDFQSTSAGLSFAGSSVYTTGTITGIASGVSVTGSGTSWLANVTTDHQLFLGTRWYRIAAITSDTTLILAEAYGDSVTFPSTYRIAIPLVDINISEIAFQSSTGTALTFTDCRNITLDNVVSVANNVGLIMTNVSEVSIVNSNIPQSTSDGAQITNGGFINASGFALAGNGGHGLKLNNVKTSSFIFSSASANTTDGVNCVDVVDCVFKIDASSNGSNGIEFVSGCNSNFINDSLARGNTSDGIKLTATSDNNTIGGSINIVGNGGYGINIAASTCDNNTILAPYFASNTSGEVNDSGTNTIQIREVQVSFVEYGDGSDGAATISGDTTLTSDKYYSSLTVNSGVTLTTGGYRIYCTGTTTNAGTITNSGGNGGNGGNGSGQTGGTAGTAGAATSAGSLPASKAGVAGAAGGNGGDSSANNAAGGGTGGNAVAESLGTVNVNGLAGVSGGNGGGGFNGFAGASGGSGGSTATTTLATTKVRNFVHATIFSNLDNGVATRLGYCSSNASGGGGGGGGGTSYQGIPQNGGGGGGSGGSGANGGYVFISSRYLVNSGTIKANGGNGGTGGNGADGSRSGGGGGGAGGDGGNGGLVVLGYTNLTNTGTIQSAGGTGGAGGSGGAAAGGGTAGSAGTTGTSGQSGLVIQFTT